MASCKRKWNDQDAVLSNIDDIPKCLQFNKYIKTGYYHRSSMNLKKSQSRLVQQPARSKSAHQLPYSRHTHHHKSSTKQSTLDASCTTSLPSSKFDIDYIYGALFSIHNESINIWSHLLCALYLSHLLYKEFELSQDQDEDDNNINTTNININNNNNSGGLRYNIIISLISLISSMVGSVYFHTFMGCCDRDDEYNACLNWDVLGVIIGMTGSCISFILHSNKCLWNSNIWFIISAYICSFIMIISSCISGYKVYNQLNVKIRAKYLGGHAFLRLIFGFVFLSHNAIYYDKIEAACWHIGSFVLLMIGGYINTFRIPERWIYENIGNDMFNLYKHKCGNMIHYVGNSHQIWHFFTIGCCLFTYYGSVWDYHNWYDSKHC